MTKLVDKTIRFLDIKTVATDRTIFIIIVTLLVLENVENRTVKRDGRICHLISVIKKCDKMLQKPTHIYFGCYNVA